MTISQNSILKANGKCNYPASPLLFTPPTEKQTNVCEISIDRIAVTGKLEIEDYEDILKRDKWVVTARNTIDGKPSVYNLFRNERIIATLSKNSYYSDSWRMDTSEHFTEVDKPQVTKITYLFTNAHITRLDIAIDFINFDDSGMNYRIYRPNATSSYFCDRAGKLETMYSGKRKSPQVYRYYNKLAELKHQRIKAPSCIKNWERLELQLRHTRASQPIGDWYTKAIKMARSLILPYVSRVNVPNFNERAKINELLRDPESFQDIGSSKTRAKYRKKIRELNKKSVPARIELALKTLEAKQNNIQDEINSFL